MSHVLARKGVLEGSSLALFLALVHTANDGVTAILGALLPTLQERLDLGPTLLAIIVAAFWIASSLLQPFFGALAEQVGPRTIGALGVVSAALFLSLVGVAPSLWVVFALIILGGMGSAALHPVGTAIAGGSYSHNRALGVGLFTAGGMVGFALGPLLILALVSKYGIEATPWLMVPGLLLGALVYVVLPRYEPHPRKPVRGLVGTNLIRGPIGLLAVAGGFTSVAFVTFTSSVPLWLVQEQGYEADAALIGWTLAVFAFAAGVSSLIGGVIEFRIGRQNLIVGSLLLTAVPLFAFLRLEPG
ncbi:MAG: MFS transporter, partial [Byssovorax sp.]